MKRSKIQKMTKEQIEAKRQAMIDKAKQLIEDQKAGRRNSPAAEFLGEIKDIVKEMIDGGLSYIKISKAIYEVYGFRVSEQTVRAFAHSVLGVPKKKRNTKKSWSDVGGDNKPKTASQIKEEAAQKRADNKGKVSL